MMIPFNHPLLMVVSFLSLTLLVGLYCSSKATTLREYAVGNQRFRTITLVATILATIYDGGTMVKAVEEVHSLGLWWIILSMMSGLRIWIISLLALRMGPFMQHLSMGETIGQVYGKYPRVITALFSTCSFVAIVAIQINIISLTISICVDWVSPDIITIFATLILIFYSTFAGIRNVTLTDILQFMTFSIIIPFLGWFMFINTGKPVSEIISFLQHQEKFQLSSVFHSNTNLLAMLALLLSALLSHINPVTIQKVYMTSSPLQAKKAFWYASFFNLVIMVLILLVPLFVFASRPELPKAAIWDYILANVPPIFKGFIAVSLLGMAMSTADACLNTCAVTVSHDILESLRKVETTLHTHQLQLARLASLVMSLLAMMVAFYCNNLLQLVYWHLNFSVPIAIAPFILAILGFRGTSRTALVGIATGTIAMLAWNQWVQPATGIDGSFVCMVANGLAMMAVHYLLPQPVHAGWMRPNDQLKRIRQLRLAFKKYDEALDLE